jgi:hypothetical protein
MGLDMYLNAKKFYSSANWRGEESKKAFDELKEFANIPDSYMKHTFMPSAYLEISVGYWRKANQIHQWFVENCQNGEDDCRTTYVSREKLQELLGLCKEVKKNPKKADELLPTSAGCFFGSQDYDEYYFEELKRSISMLTDILKMPDEWEFTYQSSW